MTLTAHAIRNSRLAIIKLLLSYQKINASLLLTYITVSANSSLFITEYLIEKLRSLYDLGANPIPPKLRISTHILTYDQLYELNIKAAYHGNLPLFKYTISHGVRECFLPAVSAIEKDRYKILQYILSNNNLLFVTDSLLYIAGKYDAKECCKILLLISGIDKYQYLYGACNGCHFTLVENLLSSGKYETDHVHINTCINTMSGRFSSDTARHTLKILRRYLL
jgi:hypothetical protein